MRTWGKRDCKRTGCLSGTIVLQVVIYADIVKFCTRAELTWEGSKFCQLYSDQSLSFFKDYPLLLLKTIVTLELTVATCRGDGQVGDVTAQATTQRTFVSGYQPAAEPSHFMEISKLPSRPGEGCTSVTGRFCRTACPNEACAVKFSSLG